MARGMTKIPCATTRFFWDKVNGKQFHPKWSACDDVSVRIQLRKHSSVKWEVALARLTYSLLDFEHMLKNNGMCSKNDTKLVMSYRLKKVGDHKECLLASKSFKKARKESIRKGNKTVNYDWPLRCKLRGKNKNVRADSNYHIVEPCTVSKDVKV